MQYEKKWWYRKDYQQGESTRQAGYSQLLANANVQREYGKLSSQIG